MRPKDSQRERAHGRPKGAKGCPKTAPRAPKAPKRGPKSPPRGAQGRPPKGSQRKEGSPKSSQRNPKGPKVSSLCKQTPDQPPKRPYVTLLRAGAQPGFASFAAEALKPGRSQSQWLTEPPSTSRKALLQNSLAASQACQACRRYYSKGSTI